MRRKIITAISFLINLLSGGILLYLLLISLYSTSYITETEYIYFVGDNWLFHTVILLAVLAGAIFLPRIKADREKSAKRILFLYACLLVAVLAAMTQRPIYDQNKVVQIASDLCRNNYQEFLRGGYAQECSNQHGYILFLAFLFRIFGIGNVLVIEVINVISILCSVVFVVKISQYLFRCADVFWALPAAVLFMPLWGYVTFIYANMLSFCLAMAALLCECEYLYAGGKMHKILLSGVLIAFSVVLKTNSVIILIAMVIILAVHIFEKKDWKRVAAVGWLLLSCLLCMKAEQICISGITGVDDLRGIPRTAHIAMGLQESSTRAAGWYNGFPMQLYEESNYEYDLTNERAVKDIKASVANFCSHPKYAVGFFVRKIASQWNEPTFASLFIQMNRSSDAELPAWVQQIIKNGIGSPVLLEIFNIGHCIILFGAFLFVCLDFKNFDFRKDGFLIIFLGGFLFHLFWEANSQYAVGYFFLLIPCSARGYLLARRSVALCRKREERFHNPVVKTVGLLSLIVLFLGFQKNNVLAQAVKLDSGSKEFQECMAEQNGVFAFSTGRYYIRAGKRQEQVLDISDDFMEAGSRVCIRQQNREEQRVILIADDEGYTLRFQKSQLVLDVPQASKEPGTQVWQWDYNGDVSQRFFIKEERDGCVSILYRDMLALTYDMDSGNVTVEEYDGTQNQLWRIDES